MIALIVIAYLACSFVAYGSILGGFTRRYPDQSNIGVAIFAAVTGPVSLPWCFVFGSLKHFRLKPLTREERYLEYDKMYGPILTRADFDARR